MMKDPAGSDMLDEKEDPAKIKSRAKVAPVYLAYLDGVESKNISFVVLPIHGYGLWSTMHAFVALDVDGATIKGVNFYEHAETPGLGGEIQNPKWVAQFVGKKLFDEAGNPAIKILKPGNAVATSEHDVDGLSGATGWNAPESADWFDKAVNDASMACYGAPCGYIGQGGTIPLMGMLSKGFPHAQMMVCGVLGPKSNAHGPNEFLHIPYAKKLTAAVAQVIAACP